MGHGATYLYCIYYCVLWSWIVCATVTDALMSDSLMISTSATSVVSGMLIYDQWYCDNKGYTNTADYITSYDNTNPSLCIGSFLTPPLIKLLYLLCSVTVGDKLDSWVHWLLYLWISCNRQMTWIKGMLKTY